VLLEPLEAVRGFAAVYVYLGHVSHVYLGKPAWSLPLWFGTEAVILFFVLSGFVIRWSTPDSQRASEYVVKRARRLYPLLCVSLVLGYILASAAQGGLVDPLWGRLVGNLGMIQDFGYLRPGVWVEQYYNPVLWSLSYESWFYGLFFIAICISGAWRNAFVIGLAVVGFASHYVIPNQISYFLIYFLIWWVGADFADEYRRTGCVRVTRALIWSATCLGCAALWLPALKLGEQGWGLYPMVDIRRFIAAAVIISAAAIIFRSWNTRPVQFVWSVFRPFRHLGRISYAVYICHFPVVNWFAASNFHIHPALGVGLITVLVFIIAAMMEYVFQNWVNRHWKLPTKVALA
jgi:peptidoglycan/LPS O-acetylase OafA/YrhL